MDQKSLNRAQQKEVQTFNVKTDSEGKPATVVKVPSRKLPGIRSPHPRDNAVHTSAPASDDTMTRSERRRAEFSKARHFARILKKEPKLKGVGRKKRRELCFELAKVDLAKENRSQPVDSLPV